MTEATISTRNTFRVGVPVDSGVQFTFADGGLSRGIKVLDLSAGGFRFVCPWEIYDGSTEVIDLYFPWLEEPLRLEIRIIRATRVELPSHGGNKVPVWETACSFEKMTIGLEDKVFRQVRELERRHIVALAS